MSFEVRQEGAFIDIYNKEKNVALARVPAIKSDSGVDEFYILDGDWFPISHDNSDEVSIPEPYFDIEQALDDFEYVTEEIPLDVIQDFKERVNKSNTLINSREKSNKMRNVKTSDRSELFFLNKDGGFSSLLYAPTKYQLNFSPASETVSGEDEFSITTEDFEPIEGYEVLAKTFTNDFSEALSEFEGIVGNVPETVVTDFVNKSFTETSRRHEVYEDTDPRLDNGVVVIDQDGKVLTYTGKFSFDFLDTVDDEDGGFSRAVIFEDEEQAQKSGSSFPSGHDYEFIPVKDAFNFIDTSDVDFSGLDISDVDPSDIYLDAELFEDSFNPGNVAITNLGDGYLMLDYPANEDVPFQVVFDINTKEFQVEFITDSDNEETKVFTSEELPELEKFIQDLCPSLDVSELIEIATEWANEY